VLKRAEIHKNKLGIHKKMADRLKKIKMKKMDRIMLRSIKSRRMSRN